MSQDLDRRDFVTRLDPTNIFGLFEDFPDQCRRARQIALAATLSPLTGQPHQVVLTGLGGSAAGGDFARALFEAQANVPFLVNRDYHQPHYVGKNSLVFCASYSGNTEETLSAYADAKKAGSRIIAVTTGGKLAELAKADGYDVILVPPGQPPRTAMGYMLIPVLVTCERLGLLPAQAYAAAFDRCDDVVRETAVEVPVGQNLAKQVAISMHGGVGVFYGAGSWQALVAGRWKGQVNENAKNLAFYNGFPELNHNEVLGWVGSPSQGETKWTLVILTGGEESPKMQARLRITRDLIGAGATQFEVKAWGSSLIEKMLSLATFGDFVSLYLAALNGVDPENIDWLNSLKAELAKVD